MTPPHQLRLADAARQDLQEIWDYLSLYSEQAADRTIDTIVASYKNLADHPFMGRSRDELQPGLRSLASDKYLIYYRVEGRLILVDRILHGARDLSSVFDLPDGKVERN